MIMLAKGRENCEVCGRFAWLIDMDPPPSLADDYTYPEVWHCWCKRHAPRWAREAVEAESREQEKRDEGHGRDMAGACPEVTPQGQAVRNG